MEEIKLFKTYKINCITPKGKAKKAEKMLRKDMFTLIEKPLSTEIVSDHEFNWFWETNNEKHFFILIKKAAKAEVKIKAFYKFVIKYIDRANKLISRGGWTARKVKNWMIKRWRKNFEGEPMDNIADMDETEFRGYIKIEDKEEIQKLMKKDLINITEV